MTDYFWQYGTIGALALLGVAFGVIAFTMNRLVRDSAVVMRDSSRRERRVVWNCVRLRPN